MKSILKRNQTREFVKEGHVNEYNEKTDLYVTVRFDDECGNGHNSLSVTANMYEAGWKIDRKMICEGCIHEEIVQAFPELKRAIDFHLCSTDGPMHYVADSLYHAGNKDCWGLKKGEKRQIRNKRTGKLRWEWSVIEGDDIFGYIDSDEKPKETAIMGYVPCYQIGEGKEPDLEAARSCAIWPDAELSDFTEEKLNARLPELLAELKSIVEDLGMIF